MKTYEIIPQPRQDRFDEPDRYMIIELKCRKFLMFEWCSIRTVDNNLTEDNLKNMIDALIEWQNQ